MTIDNVKNLIRVCGFAGKIELDFQEIELDFQEKDFYIKWKQETLGCEFCFRAIYSSGSAMCDYKTTDEKIECWIRDIERLI